LSDELRARALRLLARREHTRAELARKLAPQAESSDVLKALIDQLSARAQLSDERYAEARAHQLSRKFGAARVRRELVAKGIEREAAARFAADVEKTDLERAHSILARKYRSRATTPQERARRARFLQSRGFSPDVIRRALGSLRVGASEESP
jgi:regulatory protein